MTLVNPQGQPIVSTQTQRAAAMEHVIARLHDELAPRMGEIATIQQLANDVLALLSKHNLKIGFNALISVIANQSAATIPPELWAANVAAIGRHIFEVTTMVAAKPPVEPEPAK